MQIDAEGIKAQYRDGVLALFMPRAEANKPLDPYQRLNRTSVEAIMSPQELQVQGKREVDKKQESTIPVRLFMPTADIYEDNDALTVVLEMPGVKNHVDIKVEAACSTSMDG
jgi:HSP20 family molecular chaperone IbpA